MLTVSILVFLISHSFQDDPLHNTQVAIKAAEKILGIPHIIDAEDIINDKCDEKVALAYLGFFKDKVGIRNSCLMTL